MGGVISLLQQGHRLAAHRIDVTRPSRTAKPCKLLIARWSGVWYFVLGGLNSVERGVALVVWFLFVFLLPWCLCQSLLNMQEPCSEEQVSPQSNTELSSHWC
jgi:hypothetical protein